MLKKSKKRPNNFTAFSSACAHRQNLSGTSAKERKSHDPLLTKWTVQWCQWHSWWRRCVEGRQPNFNICVCMYVFAPLWRRKDFGTFDYKNQNDNLNFSRENFEYMGKGWEIKNFILKTMSLFWSNFFFQLGYLPWS